MIKSFATLKVGDRLHYGFTNEVVKVVAIAQGRVFICFEDGTMLTPRVDTTLDSWLRAFSLLSNPA